MAARRTDDSVRVIVVGLGRFGRSVARTLHELGYGVTAVDLDPRPVEEASTYVTLAAQGDGTDEELLLQLEADRAAVGIVAQGRSLEASVLSTLLLKRLGVQWVAAKATSDLHAELLSRVGADRAVFPERDAGARLAHALAVPSISDYLSLSPTSGIAIFAVPASFVGRALGELLGQAEARLNVVLVKRRDTLLHLPSFEERLQPGDEVVVAGPDRDIEVFAHGQAAEPAR